MAPRRSAVLPMARIALFAAALAPVAMAQEKIIFEDDFSFLDFTSACIDDVVRTVVVGPWFAVRPSTLGRRRRRRGPPAAPNEFPGGPHTAPRYTRLVPSWAPPLPIATCAEWKHEITAGGGG